MTANPSLKINEFCAAERISRSQLYIEWQRGTGPDYFLIGSHRRISEEARQRWRLAREAEAKAAKATCSDEAAA